ncbi:MAG: CPBP family intramembrane glutamic endopeptidase [Acidobacteriota bacterium]
MAETTTPNLNTTSSAVHHRARIAPLAIYIAVFFLVWSLRATVFIGIDENIESAIWKNVYSNAVKFVVWVLPVFITLRVWRLRPLTYLKLTTPVNKRGLLAGAIVVVTWFSLVVLAEAVLSGRNAGAMLFQRLPEWFSILTGVFFSPIWEEILFRGFFLNQLNETFSFWKSNLISAGLFMLVHVPYWVSKNGFSGRVMRDLANVFLLGCLFGWLMKKTNSLWPAIGAHIANNFLSGLIHA